MKGSFTFHLDNGQGYVAYGYFTENEDEYRVAWPTKDNAIVFQKRHVLYYNVDKAT